MILSVNKETHQCKVDGDVILRKIVEGTSAVTGEQFFKALVKNLAGAMGTYGAWVTEYKEDAQKLFALALWMKNGFIHGYEFDVKGTLCEEAIVQRRFVHYPDRCLELFPGNLFGAVSYMGMPLLDLDGKILGHLAVMDKRPMPEKPDSLNIFQIFSARAAAELRRVQAEKETRESREKLSRLIGSTMDVIIEIDKNFIISRINPAGEKLFRSDAGHIVGKNLMHFFSKRDCEKFKNLIKTFQRLPEDQKYLWVPGGLQARAVDGELLPTEGTLAAFEMRQEIFYSLILRNEKERIETEQKIRSLSFEAEYLKEEIREFHNFDKIVGESRPLLQVLKKVQQVSVTDATVLIQGETGTGKELIARAIHASSRRSHRPFITVNCAAIPASLVESELFGHEKGAFTGATVKRQGRFILADTGTIFLDEIGDLPVDMQVKLLRVLQEGKFERVGSSQTVSVDTRVIAATNRDLAKEMDGGNFREDLYFRLNVFPIELPPLRERDEDIGMLASFFIDKFSQRMGRTIQPLTRQDIELLNSYHWPGNVRELQNVIERAVITSQNNRLDLESMLTMSHKNTDPARIHAPPSTTPSRLLTLEDMQQLERDNLISALKATGWRVSGKNGAASLLGMNPSTLASRIKKLDIKRPGEY